ncbi:excisionase [Staphylococcus saprophyticus]|nr:excisionase [Staphylococcus saprophyticus]
MYINFTDKEIAYIKESVKNYTNEFDIYDDEQIVKKEVYESIMAKIKNNYDETYLFTLIN